MLNTLLGEGVFLHNAAGQQNKRTRQFTCPLISTPTHLRLLPLSPALFPLALHLYLRSLPHHTIATLRNCRKRQRKRGERKRSKGKGDSAKKKKRKTQTHRHGPLPLLELHVLAGDVDEQVAVAHADGTVAAADAGRRVVERRGDGDAVGDGAAVA